MKTGLLLLFSCLWFSSFGQVNPETNNSVYLELGGAGGLWSINYEKGIERWNPENFRFSVGLGALFIDRNNGTLFTAPVGIHYLRGQKHQFETVLGHNVSFTSRGQFFAQLTPAVGYRYSNPDKRVFYRAMYSPLVSYLVDFQYQNWFGVSIGLKLQRHD